MEYEEFICKVKELVQELCPYCEGVLVTKVVKNNSLELDGLVVKQKNTKILPTVYLNDYYQKYLGGAKLNAIAEEIAEINRSRQFNRDFNINRYCDMEFVRDKIVYKLIGTQRNRMLLENIPHREFIDLSVVYYCCLDEDEEGNLATVIIQNSHINQWGIDEDELYRLALINTRRRFPTVITELSKLLEELFGGGEQEADSRESENEEIADLNEQLYVASNSKRIFGAACMLDYAALDNFAKENGDFYIIPSSIHEIILVPERECGDVKRLCEIVREVNETQLEYEEVLSDSVYRYDILNSSVTKVNNINF